MSAAQPPTGENDGPGRRLRRLLAGPDILVLPGIFDGFSLRLVERAGFGAAFVSGAGISEATLGWADMGLMGCEENLRAARAFAACSGLPLLADGDTGYGNALNVHFTVQAFERAGVAGLMLEDQVWPKRCGHLEGKSVIGRAEAAEKIAAACAARRDPDFVIMARTDAVATHSLDEAIERLALYAEAGADLVFADAVVAVEQIVRLGKAKRAALCVNMGFGLRRRSTTPLLSPRQLHELGVDAVIYPRLLTSAAVQGMQAALSALGRSLQSGQVEERPDLQVSFEDLGELMGLAELHRLDGRLAADERNRESEKG